MAQASSSHKMSYKLGDVVWAKVGGHPWWPAMVYHSPEGRSFVRTIGATQKYHVQFFGSQDERAWVFDTSLLPYEGRANLEPTLAKLRDQAGKDKTRYELRVIAKHTASWNTAVRRAEEAFEVPVEQRLSTYGRVYEGLLTGNISVSTALSKMSTSSGICDKRKSSLQNKDSPASSTSPRSSVSDEEAQMMGLQLFINQFRIKLAQKHPELTVSDEDLKTRWQAMEGVVQSGFIQQAISSMGQQKTEANPLKRKHATSQEDTSSQGSSKRLKCHKSQNDDTSLQLDEAESPMLVKTFMKRLKWRTFEVQRLVTAPMEFSLEPVCRICERLDGDVRQCEGACKSWFHPLCVHPADMNMDNTDAHFLCQHCSKGEGVCPMCPEDNQMHSESVSCETADCRMMFHVSCLKGTSLVDSSSTTPHLPLCPAHFCWTCSLENDRKPFENATECISCTRCPRRFHCGDLCVPAGSLQLSPSHIVCPEHFHEELVQDRRYRVIHSHTCYVCSVNNPSVFCEHCPAAFHPNCLQEPPAAETGTFLCSDCQLFRPIRYGQIVWAKMGLFRWWPSEVVHPRNVPNNILQLAHKRGCFVAHFFGDDQYQWVSRARVIPYQVGRDMPIGKLAIVHNSSDYNAKLDLSFNDGVVEAKFGHRLYVNVVKLQVSLNSMSAIPFEDNLDLKMLLPSQKDDVVDEETGTSSVASSTHNTMKFTLIEENVFVGNLPASEVSTSVYECECTADTAMACTTESGCHNVSMQVECDPHVCRAGEHCHNQRFQKRIYPNTGVFEAGRRGYGLKALQNIAKGDFVCEYVGEVISSREAERRLTKQHAKGVSNYYMLLLDKERIIDAGPRGNLSRFINHSCEPNLVTQKWLVDGDYRIGLFALCDISEDTELTFNYNFSVFGEEEMPCFCGASNCSGSINRKANKNPRCSRSSRTPVLTSQSATDTSDVNPANETPAAMEQSPMSNQSASVQNETLTEPTDKGSSESSSQMTSSLSTVLSYPVEHCRGCEKPLVTSRASPCSVASDSTQCAFFIRCTFCGGTFHATCALAERGDLFRDKVSWLTVGWAFLCTQCRLDEHLRKTVAAEEKKFAKENVIVIDLEDEEEMT